MGAEGVLRGSNNFPRTNVPAPGGRCLPGGGGGGQGLPPPPPPPVKKMPE